MTDTQGFCYIRSIRVSAQSSILKRPMHPLETYLRRLHEIHSTERGTLELSYRVALENLRGAVEVKAVAENTPQTADGGQVAR